ncbi:hypothetical protein PPL_02104 [Heterostelium album PN500]|uniref:ATP-grasp domain-containing protein n=1 Tax=Heterostelium pallidum (strain ATCC 26659 / Pp 5 / PN500) TaxID=670386 RepID=D3B1D3_HETP5|nr:hypothetical protein PPL_02104 [Heterostelium album PN500]EFA85107.1 hypothetical protein PPL_02104 [Heterostelium album PN500]|eukprot:XP_020437216.1 hypothetical protein PPL_02104 [Heterostelium album PN500]
MINTSNSMNIDNINNNNNNYINSNNIFSSIFENDKINEECILLYGLVSKVAKTMPVSGVQVAQRSVGQYQYTLSMSFDSVNQTFKLSGLNSSSNEQQQPQQPSSEQSKGLVDKLQSAINQLTQTLPTTLKHEQLQLEQQQQPLTVTIQIFKNHSYLASYYKGMAVLDLDIADHDHLLVSILLRYLIALQYSTTLNIGNSNNNNGSNSSNINGNREALHSLLSYVQILHDSSVDLVSPIIVSLSSDYHQQLDSNQLFVTLLKDYIELNNEYSNVLKDAILKPAISSSELETFLYEEDDNSTTTADAATAATTTTNMNSSAISIKTREELIQLLNKRDTKISWYLGQLLFDLPYRRDDLRQALLIDDTKQRRDATFQVIRRFDAQVERDNVVRVSNQIREQWLSDTESFQPTLVVGRESRAFSNQATLFASSNYIRIDDAIRQVINQLVLTTGEQFIRDQFAVIKIPGWAVADIQKLADQLVKSTVHLQPVVGRLRALVANINDNWSPFTQFQGAIQHLREVLTIVTNKSVNLVEDAQKTALSRRSEGIHRRLSGNKDTGGSGAAVNSVFIIVHSVLESIYGRGSSQVWRCLYELESLIQTMPSVPSSFSVLLQRPSLSGSERFRTNELEPKAEQEEVLQKLVRIGGANLYMSPANEWVEQATDIIEAIPLFIYERLIEVDGQSTTVFEVDQEGLEQTIRGLAEQWTKNIQLTILSEHCSLAREIIVESDQQMSVNVSELMKQQQQSTRHSVICQLLKDRVEEIVKVAHHLELQYDRLAESVEDYIETCWKQSNFITRIESLKHLLTSNNEQQQQHNNQMDSYKSIYEQSMKLQVPQQDYDRIRFMALKKQRRMPAFHLLTTEAPGLVEGFIQAVLEEEMTLKNIIEYYKHGKSVMDRIKEYQNDFILIGKKVISEFNYQPILEQYQNQLNLDVDRAVLRVLGDHMVIQRQVSLLVVLYEIDRLEKQQTTTESFSLTNAVQQEPSCVTSYSNNTASTLDKQQLNQQALLSVFQQNRNDKEFQRISGALQGQLSDIERVVNGNDVYKKEYDNYIRCELRQLTLDKLQLDRPELALKQRVDKLYRNRSSLSMTTARREVIATNNLHDQMSNPRFAYSCGVMFPSVGSSSGDIRPTGARKRYHFVYGPSRVNLGKDERKSVEIWPQFVGVTDPLCAKHARAFYQLMNHNPIIRTTTAAENLKVSENQWTALVRSIRNVQALFVERLGVGDIEDLAYQFNQRGGLAVAAHKESEGYMSGPTAGYCIPKDLLFKLFVVTHQDSRKLSHVGLPAHLHQSIIRLMVDVVAAQPTFTSSGEWERWAAKEFLSESKLKSRFQSDSDSSQVKKYFQQYIEITGGVIMLHLSKLTQILGGVGVPSPLVSWGRDLHAALWSSWAEKKITLGGEQVNRSVVFPMTREIPQSGRLASKLNPNAYLPTEESLRVHMFGVYKGDDDQKPPPDVRFAWVMRAFLILSGHYKEVAMSLDEEGQLIARLSWDGFHPDSTDPKDIQVRQYLSNHFLGIPDFSKDTPDHVDVIERLKQMFPRHTTVGDITITAVPGVDSEDLLGFSAETLTLLGDEASYAQELLRSRGISIDQMKANAQLHRKFIDEWIPLSNLPATEQAALKKEIGGRIHPLALRLRGPGDNFLRDLQGQDIVVFSITHPQLLALNPATLRDLMLIGRPNSSLVAHDHVSQGRHRVWFERDVMLWYAACRAIDENGQRLSNWRERSSRGRQSIYKAFGWGTDQYQPLLGTDLRQEVERQENRAIKLFELLDKIANSTYINNTINIDELVNEINRTLFGVGVNINLQSIPPLHPNQLQNEIDMLVQYEQRVLLANRFRKRDLVIRESLEKLRDRPIANTLSPIAWLAVGGYLLLNGQPARVINRTLTIVNRACCRINLTQTDNSNIDFEKDPLMTSLLTAQLATSKIQLRDRKGKMFSVKASEEHVETAVTRRKELEAQSRRNAILKYREDGYLSLGRPHAISPTSTSSSNISNLNGLVTLMLPPIHENLKKLVYHIEESTPNPSVSVERINVTLGQTYNLCIQALLQLVHLYKPSNQEQLNTLILQLADQSTGKELDLKCWDDLVGSYEQFGAFSPLYEAYYQQQTDKQQLLGLVSVISQVMATLLLLDKISFYLSVPSEDIVENNIWRSLAEFFAKTIDDHYSEYTPWFMDPKRYPLFNQYFDDVGIMKPEYRESQYRLYWESHRSLYKLIHSLIRCKTSFSHANQLSLLGDVFIGPVTDSDCIVVHAIGASAPERYEQLWRAYNQMREISFIKNDGFQTPFIFESIDPTDKHGLDTQSHVNHCFLSPIGRTHYSRALMEGPTLGDNLFITRDGNMVNLSGDGRQVLTIHNAMFWMNEQQFRHYLLTSSSSRGDGNQPTNETVDAFVNKSKQSKQLVAKGILVAARFSRPVVIGSAVTLHHHHLEPLLSNAGYPTTDKSPFLYEMTYNKSLYPLIFNPSSQTNVLLPPEIDWLQLETSEILSKNDDESQAKLEILEKISARLVPFVKEHPIIIVKGAAESGARNLSRFDLFDQTTGQLDQDALNNASLFIYHVSKAQNVVIQRAIISSPLFWMSKEAIDRMVERQISDHGLAVELNRHPKDSVYGTLRVIMSTGSPLDSNDLVDPKNWSASHHIALNSLQIATNVGRQGSLEILTTEMIQPDLRANFIAGLEDAGRNVMAAIAKFGPEYWSKPVELFGHTFKSYHERFPHIKENDATGIPIHWPRYLMLDFIPEPIWARKDNNAPIDMRFSRLLDIVPYQTHDGKPVFTFRDEADGGQEFEAVIIGMNFWQLEPNVGIGLWPNFWKRELENQMNLVKHSRQSEIDWSKVGVSDRIVLSNFLHVGRLFLDTLPKEAILNVQLGGSKDNDKDHNVVGSGQSKQSPRTSTAAPTQPTTTTTSTIINQLNENPELNKLIDQPHEYLLFGQSLLMKDKSIKLSDETKKRLVEYTLDCHLSSRLTPEMVILDNLDNVEFQKYFPYENTCAIITGKKTLMLNHFYPFFLSKESVNDTLDINLIGIHYSWIDNEDMFGLTRCIVFDSTKRLFIDFPLSVEQSKKIRLSTCFLLELPNEELNQETDFHQQISMELEKDGVKVLNDFQKSNQRCDDKFWLRSKLLDGFISIVNCKPIQTISISCNDCITNEDVVEKLDQLQTAQLPIIIQPRSNTTESECVRYFKNKSEDQCVNYILELFDFGYDHVLASQFIQSIKTKDGCSFIVRLNASLGGLTTIAIVKSSSPDETVISPGLRKSKWVRVDSVLNNLDGFKVTEQDWKNWSDIAQTILESTELQIVGIDVILTKQIEGSLLKIHPVVLEVNARPGSLIFSEQLEFSGNDDLSSRMTTPISKQFWYNVVRNSSMTINSLLRSVLANENRFGKLLEHRYTFGGLNGGKDYKNIKDRQKSYTNLLEQSIASGFDKDKPVILTASNGRDRVFMGHSDFVGLGGFTINATTINEILCVMQLKDDPNPRVILSNIDKQFQQQSFTIDEIDQLLNQNLRDDKSIPTLWPPQHWENYIKCCLAYLLAPANREKYPNVARSLKELSTQKKSILAMFSADGSLGLSWTGGVSSSSALTGAFSISLNRLLGWNLSLEQLADIDFGEYYLGKNAGSSDKTSQLFSRKGQISVIGSIPERFIKCLKFPSEIVVLMAESPIPRLSTQKSKQWLDQQIAIGSVKGCTTEQVSVWANSIMKSFSSKVFVESVKFFQTSIEFNLEQSMKQSGLSKDELNAVKLSLENGLLRELTVGGRIISYLPELENKRKRAILTFKMLKLLPEEIEIDGIKLWMRKSILYALSEIERGFVYQELVQSLSSGALNQQQKKLFVERLMTIVKKAHEGDKQTTDYRNGFSKTAWGEMEQSNYTDLAFDNNIKTLSGKDDNDFDVGLYYYPGGYQRSLPEIDELAHLISTQFSGTAALRIAAAGLGGSVCVHCHIDQQKEVKDLLSKHNYIVRGVEPASPSSVIFS